jgi:two-component system, NarL family, sensor histidine kinase DesK
MCLKESINNVVKHSGASECFVTFKQNSNELLLSVKDNGVGFDTGKFSNGSGLYGMHERVEFINGTLEIHNNEGTELTIHIPVAITHQQEEKR